MYDIDKYIEELKGTEHSPYLASRILAKTEGLNAGVNETAKGFSFLQYLAVAACLVFVVALGVTIGSSYKSPTGNYAGILINDTYMEQLSMYERDADEQ